MSCFVWTLVSSLQYSLIAQQWSPQSRGFHFRDDCALSILRSGIWRNHIWLKKWKPEGIPAIPLGTGTQNRNFGWVGNFYLPRDHHIRRPLHRFFLFFLSKFHMSSPDGQIKLLYWSGTLSGNSTLKSLLKFFVYFKTFAKFKKWQKLLLFFNMFRSMDHRVLQVAVSPNIT